MRRRTAIWSFISRVDRANLGKERLHALRTRCERTTERRRDRRSTGKTSLKRDSKGVYGLDDVLDRSLDICRESEEVDRMQRR